jgi:hypothetical protein
MKFLKLLFFVFILFGFKSLSAQKYSDTTTLEDKEQKKHFPINYNAGIGLFNYRGDVGSIKGLGTTENFQPSFRAGIEYKVFSAFGIGLNAEYGSLVKNEKNGGDNDNFFTTLMAGGLIGNIHFANGYTLAEKYPIDPFISFGVNFLSFNPKSDLSDENGSPYYYWSDGTIKDTPNGSSDGNNLVRDYQYETEIDPKGESKTALSYLFGAGFNFYISSYLQAQLMQSVSFVNTDFLDGHVGGNANDVYMNSSFSLIFTPSGFVSKNKNSKEFDEIDFESLLKADTDADGVLDIDDKCNDTDEGIKVDRHGCPKDSDGDGIPDYLDDEIKTKDEIAKIDSNGVGISDSLVAKDALDTTNFTLRQELCQYYPSMCQGDETDVDYQIYNTGKADKKLINVKVTPSKRPIEEIKRIADINGDGSISSKEIYQTIDDYFDGKIDLKLGDIHKLIDHYFDD